MTTLGYLLAQPAAILHYLRLALLPYPLAFDYSDWPPATVGGAVLPAVVVALLLAATVWALLRYPRVGYLGAWFFLTLVPSVLLPGGPAVAEWRMYLPLAGLVVLVVVAGYTLARRLEVQVPRAEIGAAAVAGLLVVVWGFLTFLRNTDYYTADALWRDTVAQRPNNARAHFNLGNVYFQQGKPGWRSPNTRPSWTARRAATRTKSTRQRGGACPWPSWLPGISTSASTPGERSRQRARQRLDPERGRLRPLGPAGLCDRGPLLQGSRSSPAGSAQVSVQPGGSAGGQR